MSQGYNLDSCNAGCGYEEKHECFKCCCPKCEKKEEPKKEKCATIKICIEEEKKHDKNCGC